MTHTFTPAQLERVRALVTQRQRIDEMLQFFVTYVAAEAGLPPAPNYTISPDLTTLTFDAPKETP